MEALCNINSKGVQQRKQLAAVFGLSAILASLTFISFQLDALFIFPIMFMYFIAFAYILQVKLKFCITLGLLGMDSSKGGMKEVTKSEKKLFARFAIELLIYSLLFAGAASVAVLAIYTLVAKI